MDIQITIAAVSAFGSITSAAAAVIAAVGIWRFGKAMENANKERIAQAAEDRKVTQGMLEALERQGAALERQGAALERQGAALEEILHRTAPPKAGPAE